MDQLPDRIELRRIADNARIFATLRRLTRELAQEKIDGSWWETLGVPTHKREEENDHSWRWSKRIGQLRNSRWHEALAAETQDGAVQGAVLYWLNTRSFIQPEKGAIYIEALATAPRNRPWLVDAPVYRGVGESLLLRSVCHSYLLGLEGRINLVAFDDQRTIGFYKNRGLTPAGYDEDLPRFELEPDAAVSWLKEEGYEL